MRNHSRSGGRHELGQNFLVHRPTIDRILGLVADTDGSILELGAGDGVLTRRLSELGRDLTAIEIDEHRVRALRRRVPRARILHADALTYDIRQPVVVGNIPYHLTTPIMRRLLAVDRWQHAILLTQWEVARKRAGVGGSTMLTAQTAPWFTFELHGRVPARGFRPVPSVDGGLLAIRRRSTPLVARHDRRRYAAFVRGVFTGPGRGLTSILRGMTGRSTSDVRRVLRDAGVPADRLPRDLTAEQWAALWQAVSRRGGSAARSRRIPGRVRPEPRRRQPGGVA